MVTEKKLSVLVVDDEDVVRDFLIRFFSFKNMETECVESGAAAIEAARKRKFDMIFLDARMPKMSGIDAMRELKKINPDSAYVVMTGYAVDELLQEAAKEMEFRAIKKPFNMDEMNTLLSDGALEKGGKKKLRVLVVDDEEVVLSFFKRLLGEYDVTLAGSGAKAMEHIAGSDFDIVFLDITLKDTTAVVLYSEIKKAKPDLDVVIITGNPMSAEGFKHLNIKGCLYKPFEIDQILSLIGEVKQAKGL